MSSFYHAEDIASDTRLREKSHANTAVERELKKNTEKRRQAGKRCALIVMLVTETRADHTITANKK